MSHYMPPSLLALFAPRQPVLFKAAPEKRSNRPLEGVAQVCTHHFRLLQNINYLIYLQMCVLFLLFFFSIWHASLIRPFKYLLNLKRPKKNAARRLNFVLKKPIYATLKLSWILVSYFSLPVFTTCSNLHLILHLQGIRSLRLISEMR
jgi:hypothetical protein